MPRRSREGNESASISIGALSRATRIPVETLRTWERRYGAPRPERKPSGHRRYPASEIERLRHIARLISSGHRAADVVGLPTRELENLLSVSRATRGTAGAATSGALGAADTESAIAAMLRATEALDRAALLDELRSGWLRLGPAGFLDELAAPFLVKLGTEWASKALAIRHEHFATACLSDFLRAAREPYDRRANGPRVVAATLPAELHEGGLLLVSALLAVRGFQVLYLGPGTPITEIAATARTRKAEIAVVSVSAAAPRAKAMRSLTALRGALPRGVKLWTGGAGAPDPARGIERFPSLRALDAVLEVTA